jgi:ornithine--oxo-acid transaminase
MATPLDLNQVLCDASDEATEAHARHGNLAFVELLEATGNRVDCIRGAGPYLWDRSGRRILDCMAGYGAIAIGRGHPIVTDALRQCLDGASATWVRWELAPLVGRAAKELAKATDGRARRVFFTNSGTEAMEAAIKYARRATGRHGLLAWEGAFHGLTCGALSLNGSAELREGFGPLLPGAALVPFGDLDALERALARRDIAAMVVEPIQGKTLRALEPVQLREVQRLCARAGTLLVADEVQTGCGRTGSFLACQADGVDPDIVLLSKALSGGAVPVGAMLMTDEVADAVHPSLDRAIIHSSTFHEGQLAMVAVLATLKVIHEDDLVQRSARLGALLRHRCERACAGHPAFGGFLGRGLMAGLQVDVDRVPSLSALPWVGPAIRPLIGQALVNTLLRRHGVLAQVTGAHSPVLKLLPPMVIDERDIDHLAPALEQSIGALQDGSLADALGRALGSMPAHALRRAAQVMSASYLPSVGRPDSLASSD